MQELYRQADDVDQQPTADSGQERLRCIGTPPPLGEFDGAGDFPSLAPQQSRGNGAGRRLPPGENPRFALPIGIRAGSRAWSFQRDDHLPYRRQSHHRVNTTPCCAPPLLTSSEPASASRQNQDTQEGDRRPSHHRFETASLPGDSSVPVGRPRFCLGTPPATAWSRAKLLVRRRRGSLDQTAPFRSEQQPRRRGRLSLSCVKGGSLFARVHDMRVGAVPAMSLIGPLVCGRGGMGVGGAGGWVA
jgi:hypothetical protein